MTPPTKFTGELCIDFRIVMQGVPAFFDDLAEDFTCAECCSKRDHVCRTRSVRSLLAPCDKE